MVQAIHLGEERIRDFFIDHLNRICCAKTHMVKRFPEAAQRAHFADVRHAMVETMEDVMMQIDRMNEIFGLMDAKQSDKGCHGMTAMLEEAFSAIDHHHDDNALRDMAILFYMQNIESIEMASFEVLKMAATRLKNTHVTKLIKINYDEAKADRTLLLHITAKYLVS